jgi:hypothetical protein
MLLWLWNRRRPSALKTVTMQGSLENIASSSSGLERVLVASGGAAAGAHWRLASLDGCWNGDAYLFSKLAAMMISADWRSSSSLPARLARPRAAGRGSESLTPKHARHDSMPIIVPWIDISE